jgi:hypothetical protein
VNIDDRSVRPLTENEIPNEREIVISSEEATTLLDVERRRTDRLAELSARPHMSKGSKKRLRNGRSG